MKRLPEDDAWDDFVAWCEARNLSAVPAHPWTLAAYIRACEDRYQPRTLAKLIKAIGRVHATKSRRRPDRHPTVSRTLKMIDARAKKRERDANLLDDDDLLAKSPKRKKKSKPAADKVPQRKRAVRVLGSTPKLVSRRKLKS